MYHRTVYEHVRKSLTVRGHELADRRRGSVAVLHKRHLRDDDVVLEHGAAAHTHGITASLVHVHIRPTAVLTPPHGVRGLVTSDSKRNGNDEGDLFKQTRQVYYVKINSSESRTNTKPIKSAPAITQYVKVPGYKHAV